MDPNDPGPPKPPDALRRWAEAVTSPSVDAEAGEGGVLPFPVHRVKALAAAFLSGDPPTAIEREELDWTERLVAHAEKQDQPFVQVSTRRLRVFLTLVRRLCASKDPQ